MGNTEKGHGNVILIPVYVAFGSTNLVENTFDRKRIYANLSSYPNPKAQ